MFYKRLFCCFSTCIMIFHKSLKQLERISFLHLHFISYDEYFNSELTFSLCKKLVLPRRFFHHEKILLVWLRPVTWCPSWSGVVSQLTLITHANIYVTPSVRATMTFVRVSFGADWHLAAHPPGEDAIPSNYCRLVRNRPRWCYLKFLTIALTITRPYPHIPH